MERSRRSTCGQIDPSQSMGHYILEVAGFLSVRRIDQRRGTQSDRDNVSALTTVEMLIVELRALSVQWLRQLAACS